MMQSLILLQLTEIHLKHKSYDFIFSYSVKRVKNLFFFSIGVTTLETYKKVESYIC